MLELPQKAHNDVDVILIAFQRVQFGHNTAASKRRLDQDDGRGTTRPVGRVLCARLGPVWMCRSRALTCGRALGSSQRFWAVLVLMCPRCAPQEAGLLLGLRRDRLS